jgi:hypothetical protein
MAAGSRRCIVEVAPAATDPAPIRMKVRRVKEFIRFSRLADWCCVYPTALSVGFEGMSRFF